MNESNDNNVRTSSGRKPRTFAAWQEIRRKQPHLYFQSSTARKVMEDRETLGKDAFYKRDDEGEL